MFDLNYNFYTSQNVLPFPISYCQMDITHPSYHSPIHWHHQPEIVHVISGTLKLYLDGEEHNLSSNDIFYINSDIIHGYFPQNCVYEIINFDMQEILLRDPLRKDLLQVFINSNVLILPFTSQENELIYNSALHLFSVAFSDYNSCDLIALGALYQFFGIIQIQHHYTENRDTPTNMHLLKPVLKLIETSYMIPTSLSDMTKHAGISTSWFISLFQTFFHQTPVEYLNSYRIEHACLFLRNSSLKISEIAHRCGFKDNTYFTKVFKRYKSLTPRAYRQKYKTTCHQ